MPLESPPKRAVIVGSGGQDGTLLWAHLRELGYELVGVEKQRTRLSLKTREGIAPPVHIGDAGQVNSLVREFVRDGDEIYYLPAFHHSAEDKAVLAPVEIFPKSWEVHVTGLLHFLEAMSAHAPGARLFYAASPHAFGEPLEPEQDENTPYEPRCVYGITKAAGIHMCRMYRERHGMYVSAGILYNHESPLRRKDFVSQRIVRQAVAVARGEIDAMVLGGTSSVVDWGYAGDYVRAMHCILQVPKAHDFVVASCVPRTVGEFARLALQCLGLSPEGRIRENPDLVKKKSVMLIGRPYRLLALTPWRPSVDFAGMVELLVRGELARRESESASPSHKVTPCRITSSSSGISGTTETSSLAAP